ncbi:hypothetical protein D3C72_2381580 [compost metagenome]
MLFAHRAVVAQDVQHIGMVVAADLADLGILHEGDAKACACLGQPAGELMDVAGRVRRRVEAAIAIRLQRGFDVAGFAARHGKALQAACLQQRV